MKKSFLRMRLYDAEVALTVYSSKPISEAIMIGGVENIFRPLKCFQVSCLLSPQYQ